MREPISVQVRYTVRFHLDTTSCAARRRQGRPAQPPADSQQYFRPITSDKLAHTLGNNPWPAIKTETDAATKASSPFKSFCRLSSAGKKIDPVKVAPIEVKAIVLKRVHTAPEISVSSPNRRSTDGAHASTSVFLCRLHSLGSSATATCSTSSGSDLSPSPSAASFSLSSPS